MGGPIYHYDEDNASTTKFPAYWDNKAFFAEFSQDYVAAFTHRRRRCGQRDRALPAERRLKPRAADQGQRDRHRVRSGRLALRAGLR